MNETFEWLHSHRGLALVVSDRIYLYNEKTWLEPNFPVLLLNATGGGAVAATEAATTAEAAATAAFATRVPAAELLYPDGVVRWTYVIVSVSGYKNSLENL